MRRWRIGTESPRDNQNLWSQLLLSYRRIAQKGTPLHKEISLQDNNFSERLSKIPPILGDLAITQHQNILPSCQLTHFTLASPSELSILISTSPCGRPRASHSPLDLISFEFTGFSAGQAPRKAVQLETSWTRDIRSTLLRMQNCVTKINRKQFKRMANV